MRDLIMFGRRLQTQDWSKCRTKQREKETKIERQIEPSLLKQERRNPVIYLPSPGLFTSI